MGMWLVPPCVGLREDGTTQDHYPEINGLGSSFYENEDGDYDVPDEIFFEKWHPFGEYWVLTRVCPQM